MRNAILALFLVLTASTPNFAQPLAKVVFKEIPVNYKPLDIYAASEGNSKGKKLKKVGLILAAGGTLAMGGGIGLFADAGTFSASSYKYKSFSFKDMSAERIIEKSAGYTLIDLGTYAIAGGIVMIIIGNKKLRREKAGVNFTFTPVSAKFSYRF
jgi:hypothetical protein